MNVRHALATLAILWSSSALLQGCSSCGGGSAPGAEVAKLLPNYAVGVVTLKNVTEATQDVGMQQLVAVAGVDAQRGVAAMTGMLGFDPSNPATMAQAGLDPAAPIAVGVTRLQGESTIPILFIRTTDPAVATNTLMQKAPLAGITISGQTPLGAHTLITGVGEVSIAATFFDKVLAIAIGTSAQVQPSTAIQELVTVEGGQVPALATDATFQAATAAIGGADLVAYVNVNSLNAGIGSFGLGADEMRAFNELRRYQAVAAGLDIQANVLSMKYYVVPAAGGFPARLFSDDASDVAVLDRIGGAPLLSVRTTMDLPGIWAVLSPQFPELAEARQELLRETGLNLDTDVIGMLSGTFSITAFRIGAPPAGLDLVATVGLTDPMKVNRILQVLAAKGLQPTSVQMGGAFVNTWSIEGFPISMAVVGNQAVLGIGRDGNALGRIVMGQDGPAFRSQIRDPNVAQRFGRGGNGAMFVNLAALLQQVGAQDADAARMAPAMSMVDSLGGFYEPSGTGYAGEIDLRMVQGQTVANWFVTLARLQQQAAPPTPPIPAFPPPVFGPGVIPQPPVQAPPVQGLQPIH